MLHSTLLMFIHIIQWYIGFAPKRALKIQNAQAYPRPPIVQKHSLLTTYNNIAFRHKSRAWVVA